MNKNSLRRFLHESLFNGNGVARRLIVALVLFSSVLTAIITTLQLYGEYQTDVEAIDGRFVFIGDSTIPVLTDSVWVSDDMQIRSQIEGLLNLQDMEYIAISADGELRWTAGRQISEHVITQRFPLQREYRGQMIKLGELIAVASLDQVWSRLWNRLLSVLIENGIKTLLVALFMLLVFQLLVTRHLARLSLYARDYNPRDTEFEDLYLDRPPTGRWRPDALDYLVNAINDMRHKLRDVYLEMHGTNQRLEESEERLRLTMEATNEGVWDWSIKGGHVFFSPGWIAMLGYKPGELEPVYASWERRIHPADRGPVLEKLNEHLSGQTRKFYAEHRLKTRQGDWLWVLTRGAVIEYSDDGQPLRAVGTMTDISALKEAEFELTRLNEKLEQRVEERTSELVEARNEAERASLAKSTFLSRMSHELRTPLNAVLGFAQLLDGNKVTPLVPEQAEYVKEILFAGKHLLELINEILDLARVESGRLSLDCGSVNLQSLCKECISLVRPLTVKSSIELGSELGSSPQVLADPLRLRQILINLLSNAIKYNKEHGTVMLRVETTDEGKVKIIVSDTGVGIEAGNMPQLFEPFSRFGNKSDTTEGTGIGLALSKRLAEAMGGDISVRSIAGEGSDFCLTLLAYHENAGAK